MKEKIIGWIVFLALVALIWWGSAQPGSAKVIGVESDATLREVVASWVREQKEASAQRPISGGTAPVSSGSSGIAVGDEAAENAILEMINEERAKQGLPPLAMDEDLRARARERSRDMLERGYFSHLDPETGAPLADYTEIIAKGNGFNPSPIQAARWWWTSPDHYAIMVRTDVHRIGIGIARSGNTVIVTAQLNP